MCVDVRRCNVEVTIVTISYKEIALTLLANIERCSIDEHMGNTISLRSKVLANQIINQRLTRGIGLLYGLPYHDVISTRGVGTKLMDIASLLCPRSMRILIVSRRNRREACATRVTKRHMRFDVRPLGVFVIDDIDACNLFGCFNTKAMCLQLHITINDFLNTHSEPACEHMDAYSFVLTHW